MKAFRSLGYSCVLGLGLLCLPALPAEMAAPGIPNFHKVDDYVFRGGQPTGEGWNALAKLGVKTVIDLRREDEHSTAAEAQAVRTAGMRYMNVPMKGIVAPNPEDIARILKELGSKEPVFVHCREGKDRTGTVVACYRMSHDAWDNHKALKEAKSFGMHWFEPGMKAYILGYQAPMQRAEAVDGVPALP